MGWWYLLSLIIKLIRRLALRGINWKRKRKIRKSWKWKINRNLIKKGIKRKLIANNNKTLNLFLYITK